MADNTTLNPGAAGDTISTDDLGTVKVQRVKVQYGVDGSATDVSTTNPMPISDAAGSITVDDGAGSLTVDGTVTANLAAGTNNIGDVDVLTLPATAADGAVGLPATTVVVAGYDGTNVQAIVTDSAGRPQVGVNGTVAVTDNGGSLTVDGTVGVSGTVTVDSELTTADLDTGAGTDTRAVVGLVIAKSGGAANISTTDPLPISDAGGSLTVDGTVTANAGSGPFPVSDNAGSLTVDAPVGTPAFVRLSDGAAAITTLPVSLATLPALTAGTAAIGKLAANSGVDIGDVDVLSIAAGTNAIGNVGLVPRTTGGLTLSKTISAASTNATSVKGSAGQVFWAYVSNINAAVRYLKFYNKATAPTVGTDTPVLTLAIPGNTAGAGAVIPIDMGLAFATGIAFAITTGVADADTGAVAANELVVNLGYA